MFNFHAIQQGKCSVKYQRLQQRWCDISLQNYIEYSTSHVKYSFNAAQAEYSALIGHLFRHYVVAVKVMNGSVTGLGQELESQ